MASSLVAQLSQVAANSTNPLDLKAQRVAHSHSLIFERGVAISQDFDTIYQICYEGFQELCLLDARFTGFDRDIFSEQSKGKERTRMTAAENKELDVVLEKFIALVGGRLLLAPAIKAVEWLVRRFRVHEYNTICLVFTFLPYHTAPLFLNLLAILPESLTPTFKVLHPYKKSLVNPPRHPLVHSATTNQSFCSGLNRYVLHVCEQKAHHHGLLAFWAGIMSEAVARMLESSRSGHQGIEKQKHEDILLRFIPVLNDGLAMKHIPELVVGCYMLAVILAKMTALEEKVLDALMETVAGSWNKESLNAGMICLSILAQEKHVVRLPKKVCRKVVRLQNAVDILVEVKAQKHQMSQLLLGLISGCLGSIGKEKDVAAVLNFIKLIFKQSLLDEPRTRIAIMMVLQATSDAYNKGRISLETQMGLSEFIHWLNDSESFRPLFLSAASEPGIDVARLERSLQIVLAKEAPALAIENIEMQDADSESDIDTFSHHIELLTGESLHGSSFLTPCRSGIFDRLVQAFAAAVGSQDKLDAFTNLPVLGKRCAANEPQFLSFFIRVFSGPYPVAIRIAAIAMTTSHLSSTVNSDFDAQALLPYLITALSDPSEKIRREATNLLIVIANSYEEKVKDNDISAPWARDTLYTRSNESIQWLSKRDAQKVVCHLLPSLEDYSTDPNHIGIVVGTALRGSPRSKAVSDSGPAELKKSLRHSLFSFLCSNIIIIPAFTVKLRLLRLLDRVDKVGSSTRTKELRPLLEKWRVLREEEVAGICELERISVAELEEHMVTIVTTKEKQAVDILISSLEGGLKPVRPTFITAVFDHLKRIWIRLREDRQLPASERLLQLSLGTESHREAVRNGSRDVLRSVPLPGPVLEMFIGKIPSLIADTEAQGSSPKRRRTSCDHAFPVSPQNELELRKAIEEITFILELVDSSTPENHPQLATGLFQVLAALHHLKTQSQSGSSYLICLTLGSLFAIVDGSKTKLKAQFDTSVIRADLIVDCVRTTESPQVQNTALLLVAGLAVVAPELVLHSVMPIFTFMGSNMLRKEDEYSVHVIDQTIDQVVPALVQSLRNQKRDVVSGTSELLLSFTTAFEHIPSHRRHRLFIALITKLGVQDFLFAVLAMLANHYAMNKDVLSLMSSLVTSNGPELQLITFKKYLDLVSDSLQPKPGISQVLLNIRNGGEGNPSKVAENLLRSLAYLLKHSSLSSEMSNVFSINDSQASTTMQALFLQILEHILALADAVNAVKAVSQACGDVLGSLLNTLSLIDFLRTVTKLLQRLRDDLRRKVLRLLESRLRQSPVLDSQSRREISDFLPTLLDIIKSSSDILLKHAAVACVDCIAEQYGKTDPLKLVVAAKVIAGETCIGQLDDRLRVMGLLCLASMIDVLGQAVIPALPCILGRSLSLLEISLENGKENLRVHDAAFSLLSALFDHIPFMMSDRYLDSILRLSFKSARSGVPTESHDIRLDMLKLVARKVDVRESFSAVERNWPYATGQGPEAIKEVLDMLSLAIEQHPKSDTIKNVGVLTKFFRKAFDLRREQIYMESDSKYGPSDLENIEDAVSAVAIQMIYKLNDTTFRPLFIELVEWATNGIPSKDLSGTLRLTAFYGFLEKFFGTLKSIITSYASYIIDNVVEVLKTARPICKDTESLWLVAIRMLRNAFEHDQDEFWQSPSHLAKISTPLISQLSHVVDAATATIFTTEAVPAITELAVVANSPDNHKDLNSAIMKFLRPSPTPAGKEDAVGENPHTRLAALKVQQSLTERLGEEWLGLLPEMLPYISELMEDEDEAVEREVRKWIKQIEVVLGEKLDDMLV